MTAETTMWPFLLLRHLHVCLQQHSFRKPRHREKNHRSFGFPGNLQHFHWPSCPRCCLCHGWPIRGRATNVTVEQPKVAMEDSNCSGAIENRSGFPTVVPSLQGNGNASPRMVSGKMRLPAQRWWKKQNTTCFLMVLVKLARLSATMKPPMSDEPATSLIFLAILLCNSDIAHMHSPMLPPLAKHNLSLIEHPHDQDITASGRLRCRSMAKTTGRISYPVLDSDIQTDTPGIAGLDQASNFDTNHVH